MNTKFNLISLSGKNKIIKAGILLLIGIFSLPCFSNNIRTTTPVLTGQNTGNHTTFVKFNLTWDNSWRDIVNRDAAWIFIKFKVGQGGLWKHATLTSAGHIAPGDAIIDAPSDLKGAFIYRSSNGTGNNNFTNIQLQWNYAADGVADNVSVIVKVFAIEMVYIPQGSFWLGDGTTNNVAGQLSAGNTNNPFLVSSENAIGLGGGSEIGNRNAAGMITPDDFNNVTFKNLPAIYPKGYNAFYCMKYEISQEQYVEFLNNLTRILQSSGVETNITTDIITNIYVMSNTNTSVYRNTIVCPPSGNGTVNPIVFSTNRPDRACNYLKLNDGLLYADWSALRPMTELEYEKICRGDQTPVADELSCGSVNAVYVNTITGPENGTETANFNITPATLNTGNFTFIGGDGGVGPLRCGIFARNPSNREQSGGSYYGVMEMSGNLYERTMPVGHSGGRSFEGNHGDGDINAWPPNWPFGNFIGGFRGGDWSASYPIARISDRTYSNWANGLRQPYYGFRCVRTAPQGTMHPDGNNKN